VPCLFEASQPTSPPHTSIEPSAYLPTVNEACTCPIRPRTHLAWVSSQTRNRTGWSVTLPASGPASPHKQLSRQVGPLQDEMAKAKNPLSLSLGFSAPGCWQSSHPNPLPQDDLIQPCQPSQPITGAAAALAALWLPHQGLHAPGRLAPQPGRPDFQPSCHQRDYQATPQDRHAVIPSAHRLRLAWASSTPGPAPGCLHFSQALEPLCHELESNPKTHIHRKPDTHIHCKYIRVLTGRVFLGPLPHQELRLDGVPVVVQLHNGAAHHGSLVHLAGPVPGLVLAAAPVHQGTLTGEARQQQSYSGSQEDVPRFGICCCTNLFIGPP
jgi:hypothetical protein